MTPWKCPLCGSTEHLVVAVTVSAHLRQGVNMFDNFETEVGGDHEWDDDSPMWCEACGWSGAALDADTADRLTAHEMEDHRLNAAQLEEKYTQAGSTEHPQFTPWDWTQRVAQRGTVHGYWQWVEARIQGDNYA